MKYSLSEVKAKTRRENAEENKNLHPLASRLSIYFSWIFINLGLSPNLVTGLFFLVGLTGALILLFNSWIAVILSYILFRLHIVIDVSDGEVARFTKKFSINGSYWDSMIHAFLYPIFFLCMCIAQYYTYGDSFFLIIGSIGGVIVSLMLSVKNNYYRAMLFNKKPLSDFKSKTDILPKSGVKFFLFSFVSECLSFEGLYLGYLLAYFIQNQFYFKILLILYISAFSLITLVKFYQLSTRGFYTTRS